MTLKKMICALCLGVGLSACGIGGLSFGLFPGGVSLPGRPYLQAWTKHNTSPEQRRLDCAACGGSCGLNAKVSLTKYEPYCWSKPNQPEFCQDHLDRYPIFSKLQRLSEATQDELPSLETENFNTIKGNIDKRLRRKWEQCMIDKGYLYFLETCTSPGNCRPVTSRDKKAAK